MARAPSSSPLLLLLLVAAAAVTTSVAATLDGSASGNWTEELRWAARRERRGWRRARRKAFENGLGRTPQMGYVT
jgi:alpha-galactosidase